MWQARATRQQPALRRTYVMRLRNEEPMCGATEYERSSERCQSAISAVMSDINHAHGRMKENRDSTFPQSPQFTQTSLQRRIKIAG
jgi:hypothetical protein